MKRKLRKSYLNRLDVWLFSYSKKSRYPDNAVALL